MDISLLVEGRVFYQCGSEAIQGAGERLLVSTWLYKGKRRKKFSSSDCDVPFEFYEFEECVSFDASSTETSERRNVVFIPSVKQFEGKMLTLEELIDELQFWNGHTKAAGPNGAAGF